MKKFIKKLAIAILTVALTISAFPVSTYARFVEENVEAKDITNIVTISEGQTLDVIITRGDKNGKWFKFTPTTTDIYAFYGISDIDTYVSVYELQDTTYKRIDSNDDSDDRDFSYIAKLTAGKTYYFAVSTYHDYNCMMKVSLSKRKAIKSVSFVENLIPAIPELDMVPTIAFNNTYEDNSSSKSQSYIEYSSDLYNEALAKPNSDICLQGYTDKFENYVNFYIVGSDYKNLYDGKEGKYNFRYKVYDYADKKVSEGSFTIDSIKFEQLINKSKKIEIGDILTSDEKMVNKITPYVLTLEEDEELYLENLIENETSDETYIAIVKQLTDKTYETDNLYSNNYVSLKKGTYYLLFIPDSSGRKYLLGYERYHAYVPAKKINVNASLSIGLGENKNLGVTLSPSTANSGISYLCDNEAVVKVDTNGNVNAVGIGTANITIVSSKIKATCKVTVTKKNQVISVKKLDKKLKAKVVKKKKQTINILKKVAAQGGAKLNFKKIKGSKKIKISSKGIVTVSKGLKKGKYALKIRISSNETAIYQKASVTKKMIITIK